MSHRKLKVVGLLMVVGLSLCFAGALSPEARGEDDSPRAIPTRLPRPASWSGWLFSVLFLAGSVLLILHIVRSLKGKGFFPLAPRNQVSWGRLDILMVGGFLLLMTYLLSVAAYYLRGPEGVAAPGLEQPESSGIPEVLGLLPSLITSLYLLALVRSRGREKLRDLGLKSENLLRLLGLGTLGYVIFFPLLVLSSRVAFRYLHSLGYEPQQQELVRIIVKLPPLPLVIILVLHAIIMGPLVEELIFRGFIQGYLCQRMTAAAGVLFASLVFAALHWNLYASTQVFFLSLALGYIYHRTQSLAAPVALHGLHNAIQVLVLISSL